MSVGGMSTNKLVGKTQVNPIVAEEPIVPEVDLAQDLLISSDEEMEMVSDTSRKRGREEYEDEDEARNGWKLVEKKKKDARTSPKNEARTSKKTEEARTSQNSRTARTSVKDPQGAARTPPLHDRFTVTNVKGFPSVKHFVWTLLERNQRANARVLDGLNGKQTILALNEAAKQLFNNLSDGEVNLDGKTATVTPVTKQTRVAVTGVPTDTPDEAWSSVPGLISQVRIMDRKTKKPTRLVMATFGGPVPNKVKLGCFGSFRTRPWSPEPIRCYNCQKFGHMANACHRAEICGVCAGNHNSKTCFNKHKAGSQTVKQCQNCKQNGLRFIGHMAVSPWCPSRKLEVTLIQKKRPIPTPRISILRKKELEAIKLSQKPALNAAKRPATKTAPESAPLIKEAPVVSTQVAAPTLNAAKRPATKTAPESAPLIKEAPVVSTQVAAPIAEAQPEPQGTAQGQGKTVEETQSSSEAVLRVEQTLVLLNSLLPLLGVPRSTMTLIINMIRDLPAKL